MLGFFAALRMTRFFNFEKIRLRQQRGLGVGSVALFVFLSGAAWAGVVAAYLFSGAAGGGAVGVGRGGADGAGLLKFALFLLVELALEGVDGGGWGAVGYGCWYWLACCGGVGVLRRAACRQGVDGVASGEFLLGLHLGCGCRDLGLRVG